MNNAKQLCLSGDFEALAKYTAEHLNNALSDELLRATEPVPERLLTVTNSYPLNPGKGLRPLLALISCFAAGGDPDDIWPVACSLELFHNWTLIHDDIIDHDNIRRGRPTGHVTGANLGREQLGLNDDRAAELGQHLALLGGDLLQSRVFRLLLTQKGLQPAVLLDIIDGFASRLYPELLAGEYLDVEAEFFPPEHNDDKEVAAIMELKTGALMSAAAEFGAIAGSGRLYADNQLARQLGQFARLCGIAFQLQDDILGLVGEAKKFGKPIGSDLREGKHTAILGEARRRLSLDQWTVLKAVLGRADATAAEVENATALLKDCGAIDYAAEQANAKIQEANEILAQAELTDTARGLLRQWGGKMLGRQF